MHDRQYTHAHRAAPLLSGEQLAQGSSWPSWPSWPRQSAANWANWAKATTGPCAWRGNDSGRARATSWPILRGKPPSREIKLRPPTRRRASSCGPPGASIASGGRPILHPVWCFDGVWPTAPLPHRYDGRYDGRYLLDLVPPASWRAVFDLANSVSIRLFEVELEAIALQAGASPETQIVEGVSQLREAR